MRKHFHTAEASFPLRDPACGVVRAADAQTSGRADNSRRRGVVRRAFARRVRDARGTGPVRRQWRTGNLQLNPAPAGRTAESPPAFRPRSRSTQWQTPEIPCPFPSRLRTKTGMASGNLVHFRRSFSVLTAVHADLSETLIYQTCVSSTLGAKSTVNPDETCERPHSPDTLQPQDAHSTRNSGIFGDFFAFIGASETHLVTQARQSASFCYTWVISVHFSLTTFSA